MNMTLTRRQWLAAAGGLTATTALPGTVQAAENTPARWPASSSGGPDHPGLEPGQPGRDYTPVSVPGGAKLPWKIVDGVKVYHLIAEEVEHEFAPGLKAKCWGYNGGVHGPLIEAVEGDRVRIYVTNRLPAPTTVHWHGVFLVNGMDGVGGITQPVIRPGETFRYEWTFRQSGTLMYHPHHDEMTQMAMGMMGLIVVHPRGVPEAERPDRDFAILLSEWKIEPGARRPDPMAMNDFNLLTMNGKCFPGTESLVAKLGDKVRIRFGNLSAMDHHPIHLHGFYFNVVGTDGGEIPVAARWPETTVLVPTGSTRDIEFVADAEGDWPMHCHMTHHLMNQMGHGLPNILGVDLSDLDARIRQLVPGYMSMGATGMGEMAEMSMDGPANSLSTYFAPGQYDPITMG
ncbi:MAG TPA: multicopper oxidase domain-containing protein, partial [Thiobacillaceae bacterium]|nr:multicopper oxidase domain-containing protein [Thiobacillaceae bacterium]